MEKLPVIAEASKSRRRRISEGATLDSLGIVTIPLERPPAARRGVVVGHRVERELDPGSYSALTGAPGGVMRLRTETYLSSTVHAKQVAGERT